MATDGNGQDRATQAYERLRHLIVNGNLAPGARIIETDVADRLGVSRTPVRAALQRLEQEGFVQNDRPSQRWRPSVAPLTVEDSEELFYIIGQLEGLAAWHAARLEKKQHERLLARMRESNRALAELSREGGAVPNAFFEKDQEFHATYWKGPQGPRLTALLEGIKPQAERYIRVYVHALLDKIGTSVEEHEVIIRAIESRDADAAQRAVEQNWRGAAERIATVIEQIGERGSW
jgi:DNA-binding GntR family transcriptional regulator